MPINKDLDLKKDFYEIIKVDKGLCDLCGNLFEDEAIRLKNLGTFINGNCYCSAGCTDSALDAHYEMSGQISNT